MPKVPDPVAYARSMHASSGGRPGWLDKHPDALEVVKVWVEEWKSKRSDMTYGQAVTYLRKFYGYPSGPSALRAYVNSHFGVDRG